MPNICSCMLQFDGSDEELEEILRFLSPDPDSDSLDFEKIIPLPEFLRETHFPFGHVPTDLVENINEFVCGYKSAYDFCCTRWGTKWNADNVFVNRTSKTFFFDTAWCPPAGIYMRLSEMFPNVSVIASAFEGGCGICEIIKYEKGSVVDEYYPEYHSKEWYELMFEVEGGEDLYEYDESTGTYKEKE